MKYHKTPQIQKGLDDQKVDTQQNYFSGNVIFESAFKVGHSTETALLCIKNEIHLSLSKGMPTALVLLDLSAAFDTSDHDTLLSYLSGLALPVLF